MTINGPQPRTSVAQERMSVEEFRRTVLPDSISEDDLKDWIISLAKVHGWLVHHSRPALTQSGSYATALQGDRGLPDLILVRAPVVIFAELKSMKGKMGKGQPEWREALEQCPGVLYRLWRPSDRDEIVAVLEAR